MMIIIMLCFYVIKFLTTTGDRLIIFILLTKIRRIDYLLHDKHTIKILIPEVGYS